MLSNPEIKNEIISLKLSNKDTCGQIDTFLSLFSLDEFSYLQSLTLIQVEKRNREKLKVMLTLIPQLCSFRLIDSHIEISNALPFTKLQTLGAVRKSRDRSLAILDSLVEPVGSESENFMLIASGSEKFY